MCTKTHRHSLHCILPPYILSRIAEHGPPELRAAAMRGLLIDPTIRMVRAATAGPVLGALARLRTAAGVVPAPAPLRRAGRRAPAGPADVALKLLLRHSDWWERLSAADHALLHGLGGRHGAIVAWLERQLVEHGARHGQTAVAGVEDADRCVSHAFQGKS